MAIDRRYRHHVQEHVPIDFRTYPNYDPAPAMSGQPVMTHSGLWANELRPCLKSGVMESEDFRSPL